MSAPLSTAYIEIRPTMDPAKAKAEIERSLGGADGAAAGAGQRIGDQYAGGIKGKLSALGGDGALFKGLAAGAAVAGLGVLTGGLSGFVEAARESRQIAALTQSTIEATGGAAGITADQVGELATAISNKTGADDEAIQSAANLILTFKNVRNEVGAGNDIFDQTVAVANDMATVMGGDASSQAIALGKALNDPIKGVSALSRVGVTFTEQQKDQIKTLVESGKTLDAQKIILGELGSEFGGAAEAAADPLQRLGVVVGNLQEDIGTALLPVIDDFADVMAGYVVPALSATAGFVSDNSEVIVPLAAAVGGLALTFKAVALTHAAWGAVATTFNGGLATGIARLAGFSGATVASTAATGTATAGAAANTAVVGTNTGAVVANTGARRANMLAMAAGTGGLGLAAVAIGAAGFALSNYLEKNNTGIQVLKNSKAAVEGFTAAVKADGLAVGDNTKKAVALQLQQSGIADKANKAGITLADLTNAVTGTDKGFEALADTWKKNGEPADSTVFALAAIRLQMQGGEKDANEFAGATDELGLAQDGAAASMDNSADKVADLGLAYSQAAQSLGVHVDEVHGYAKQLQIADDASASYAGIVKQLASQYGTANAAQSQLMDATLDYANSAGTAADQAKYLGSVLVASQGDVLGVAGAFATAYGSADSFAEQVKGNSTLQAGLVEMAGKLEGVNLATADMATYSDIFSSSAAPAITQALGGIQAQGEGAAKAWYEHQVGIVGTKQASDEASALFRTTTHDALVGMAGDLGISAEQAGALAGGLLASDGIDPEFSVIANGLDSANETLQNLVVTLANLDGATYRSYYEVITNYTEGERQWQSDRAALLGDQPEHARGTMNAPGGRSKVGEEGWEYVDLPAGSKVYPHSTSMLMEESRGNGGGQDVGQALHALASAIDGRPTVVQIDGREVARAVNVSNGRRGG